jgi:DUF4097 and DUF4098 domain-containing protein YvlB
MQPNRDRSRSSDRTGHDRRREDPLSLAHQEEAMRNPSFGFCLCLLTLIALSSAPVAQADSRWPMETVDSFSFDVGSGSAFKIDVPDADRVLKRGSANQIEIEIQLGAREMGQARARYDAMNFRASQNGDHVSLEADHTNSTFSWKNSGGFQVVISVSLPADLDMEIETDDGDVSVEAVSGKLELRTSDGDVHVGVASGPEAIITSSDGDIVVDELDSPTSKITTSDGDIRARRIVSGEVRIGTSDGDIRIDDVGGTVSARSSDGDISVEADVFQELSLQTADGDIEIRTSAGVDLDIRGESVSVRGTFDGEKGEAMARGSLNGGGPLLKASSHDGSVVVSAR